MEIEKSTEDKIKEAAKTVFLSKGFEGCSSREIAGAAGMNVALVNYYFKSKGQLFQIIFEAALEDFINSMMDVFKSDESLEVKMRIFLEKEYDFLAKHPQLPSFVLNELNRENGCVMDHACFFEKIVATGIFEQCIKAQEAGKMRKISLFSMTLLMMSNTQYPTMGKNLMKEMHKIDDAQFDNHLLLHKQYVTEMLINYLFIKQ